MPPRIGFGPAGRLDPTRTLYVKGTALRHRSPPEATKRAIAVPRARNREKYRRLPRLAAWWLGGLVAMIVFFAIAQFTLLK
jgi:hypothetical protein